MQTPTILMMVSGFLALGVVGVILAAQACLALILWRESRKLDGALEVQNKYASVAADQGVLRKNLNALEEVVATKLNRIATTDKRRKKAEKEDALDQEETLPAGLEFPSWKDNLG